MFERRLDFDQVVARVVHTHLAGGQNLIDAAGVCRQRQVVLVNLPDLFGRQQADGEDAALLQQSCDVDRTCGGDQGASLNVDPALARLSGGGRPFQPASFPFGVDGHAAHNDIQLTAAAADHEGLSACVFDTGDQAVFDPRHVPAIVLGGGRRGKEREHCGCEADGISQGHAWTIDAAAPSARSGSRVRPCGAGPRRPRPVPHRRSGRRSGGRSGRG